MKGAWGEKAAAEWLVSRGWHILERNYRTRFGELDIIAENERFLVFFEVKTRRNARLAAACEAVTPAKQARLQSSPAEKQPRFDVIEVYGEEGAAAPRIRQIENAFGG